MHPLRVVVLGRQALPSPACICETLPLSHNDLPYPTDRLVAARRLALAPRNRQVPAMKIPATQPTKHRLAHRDGRPAPLPSPRYACRRWSMYISARCQPAITRVLLPVRSFELIPVRAGGPAPSGPFLQASQLTHNLLTEPGKRPSKKQRPAANPPKAVNSARSHAPLGPSTPRPHTHRGSRAGCLIAHQVSDGKEPGRSTPAPASTGRHGTTPLYRAHRPRPPPAGKPIS